MHIRGRFIISVDDVDVEQATINKAAQCHGMPETIHAMIAAHDKPDFKAMYKIAMNNGGDIQHVISMKIPGGWQVGFDIDTREKAVRA